MAEIADVNTLLDKLTSDTQRLITERKFDQPLLIGIHTGGVWLAEHLHQRLGLSDPLGVLNISFYRDDFSHTGLNPTVNPSALPVATENRHILLVDDVLMTGRTIRAALNELFDWGRPASVALITLVDLNARELPVQPDVVGQHLDLPPGQRIKLSGPDPLMLNLVCTLSTPT